MNELVIKKPDLVKYLVELLLRWAKSLLVEDVTLAESRREINSINASIPRLFMD